MESLNINELAPPLVLSFVLNGFGYFLKQTPYSKDWAIPFILMILGAIIYPFVAELDKMQFNVKSITVFNALIGAGIGALAVGLNQAFKQFTKRNEQ
jgi:hypothetical protein